MGLGNFIVILLIFSVSNGSDEQSVSFYGADEENTINEGTPYKVQLEAMLSVLTTDIYRKLSAMEIKLSNKLYELETKLDGLEKTKHDLERTLDEKLHKLEKNIILNLEEHINTQSDSLEKHIYRKMDELEKMLPDKTDINIVNYKLDALNKLLNLSHSDGSAFCKSNINQNSSNIEKKISKLENITTSLALDMIYKNCTDLEESSNIKATEIKQIVPAIEQYISGELHVLKKNISKHFEDSVNPKFLSVETQILNIKENSTIKCDSLNYTQSITDQLNEIKKIIPELEQHLNTKIDTLEKLERNILKKVNKTRIVGSQFTCKIREVHGYDYNGQPILMANEAHNYVSLESDASGLTYFEMRFAIKSRARTIVALYPSSNSEEKDGLAIDVGNTNNMYTAIDAILLTNRAPVLYGPLASADTPGILSPTKFSAFYVKIQDGMLEFGKPGTDFPIAKFRSDLLKRMKYIDFITFYTNEHATILYDCPPHFEDEFV